MSTLEPQILVGDVRAMLATLEPESVQMACTSPPYFGLRSYSTNPQLWGGDPLCAHAWDSLGIRKFSNLNEDFNHRWNPDWAPGGKQSEARPKEVSRGAFCSLCGCWRGELGSEPSVEQYLSNLVEVFRAVRRVLRPDGVLWLNLGDSMSNSGKGPSGHNGLGSRGVRQETRQGFSSGVRRNDIVRTAPAGYRDGGLSSSDLCGACAAVLAEPHSARNDSQPARESSAYEASPSQERSHSHLLESSSLLIPSEQSCLAMLDQPQARDHADAQPLSSPASMPLESSLPPLAGCSHCANCGACLSVLRSSSRDVRLCAHRSAYIGGTGQQIDSLADHMMDTELSYRALEHPPYIQPQYTKLAAKNLMLIPFRVAAALQADGWIVRSAIPWLKASAMPESVTDRPSVSLEWMFLLAKSDRYYYDPEAVRGEAKYGRREWSNVSAVLQAEQGKSRGIAPIRGHATVKGGDPSAGRNRRNGDWYLESLDLLIDGLRDYADELEATRDRKGLLLDPDGSPLGLLVNPQALAAAHFASFPTKLVEPLIKASSRPGDVVLDPFGGSGTVGLVARALGRRSILIDLSASYVEEIARPRVRGERLKATRPAVGLGPLFPEAAS